MFKLAQADIKDEAYFSLLKKLELEAHTQTKGFLDWDVRTGQTSWDETWSELFGLPRETLSGNAGIWEERIFTDDFPEVMDKLNEHLNGKTPHFIAEYRLEHSLGNSLGNSLENNPENKVIIRTCGVALARNLMDRPERVVFVSEKVSGDEVEPVAEFNPWSCSLPRTGESEPSP